ncbi:hypothetical protein ACFL27_02865 [candidate division CSSED10-310 bacterium]|uniref:Uncharacterized protein n=1 Tax=candidate division CSSED10-310 bacterium TaxID=2855610 RepID=A0ABV6YSF0_UNCC1
MPDLKSRLTEKPGVPDTLWQEAHPLWGDAEFKVQVYTLEFILRGLDTTIISLLHHLQMEEGTIPVRSQIPINVLKSPVSQFKTIYMTDREYRITFENTDSFVLFYGYFFAARFCFETNKIELFLAQAKPETLAAELDNFLRVASSLYLQQQQIFLFHSAAVSVNHSTFVFFGPHNAGKSTMALLSPPASLVLGDDLNALVLKQDGLYVASLPFPSEMIRNRPQLELPVTALFKLEKDEDFYFSSMSPAEKIAALYGSMPVLNQRLDDFTAFREVLLAVSGSVPLCRLHFTLQPEVFSWLLQNRNSIPR